MRYTRIEPYTVEAVQLISQRVGGSKLITKWSSCPKWFADKIDIGDIYINPYSGTLMVSNFDVYEDDLCESNWIIKEDNDSISVVEDRYFLDHYKLDEEFNYEEYAKNIYTHEFEYNRGD
jgi:hypothetical protein